jgi:hypothetical protein
MMMIKRQVRIAAADAGRPRWNASQHARWQKKVAGRKISNSNAALAQRRADRDFKKQ